MNTVLKCKVPGYHISEFYSHLGILLKSGIQLAEGIRLLKHQQHTSELRAILSVIYDDLGAGFQLSDALSRFSDHFKKTEINSVYAAEHTGCLSDTLIRLGELKAKDTKREQKIRIMVIYPAAVFSVAILVLIAISLCICKNLFPAVIDSGIALPPESALIYTCSKALSNPMTFVILAALTYLSVIICSKAYKANREKIEAILWNLPVIGKFIKVKCYSSMCSAIALMYKSGTDLLEAVEISAMSAGSSMMENIGRAIKRDIIDGCSLEESFRRYFPKVIGDFVAVGEETGTLSESFATMSNFYEQETELTLKTAETLLEPAMITVMGVVTCIIILATLSPVYKFTMSLSY